jgi:DnaJ-class molecular chaperone
MAQIHTHYDDLRVARNAPPEVIRAAYKALAQKFHPDRNPGDFEAARIMVIINTSYEVLSDPDKRKEYDLAVAQQELMAAQRAKPNSQPPPAKTTSQKSATPTNPASSSASSKQDNSSALSAVSEIEISLSLAAFFAVSGGLWWHFDSFFFMLLVWVLIAIALVTYVLQVQKKKSSQHDDKP